MQRSTLLFMLIFLFSLPVGASERLLVEFKLTEGGKMVNKGSDILSGKPHSWSRGMKRSYLKLRCNDQNPGQPRKTYSTEDHFSGLILQFKPVTDGVQVTVTRSNVTPRLKEIRALKSSECKDLVPVVNTTTGEFHILKSGSQPQVFEFGKGMKLSVQLVQL